MKKQNRRRKHNRVSASVYRIACIILSFRFLFTLFVITPVPPPPSSSSTLLLAGSRALQLFLSAFLARHIRCQPDHSHSAQSRLPHRFSRCWLLLRPSAPPAAPADDFQKSCARPNGRYPRWPLLAQKMAAAEDSRARAGDRGKSGGAARQCEEQHSRSFPLRPLPTCRVILFRRLRLAGKCAGRGGYYDDVREDGAIITR